MKTKKNSITFIFPILTAINWSNGVPLKNSISNQHIFFSQEPHPLYPMLKWLISEVTIANCEYLFICVVYTFMWNFTTDGQS